MRYLLPLAQPVPGLNSEPPSCRPAGMAAAALSYWRLSMRTHWLTCALLLATLLPYRATAGAQDTAAPDSAGWYSLVDCGPAGCLQAGSRVRVTAALPPLRGHVASVARLTQDTLYLADSGASLAVPLAGVKRLELSRGRTGARSVLGRAAAGALLGAVAGGVLGLCGSGGCGGRDEGYGDGMGILVGVPVGAAAGALLGGLSGVGRADREIWRRVPMPLGR